MRRERESASVGWVRRRVFAADVDDKPTASTSDSLQLLDAESLSLRLRHCLHGKRHLRRREKKAASVEVDYR